MNKFSKGSISPVFLLVIGLLLITGTVLSFYFSNRSSTSIPSTQKTTIQAVENKFEKFSSVNDFKQYLSQGSSNSPLSLSPTTMRSESLDSTGSKSNAAYGIALPSSPQSATRVSETNVQVLGIDEPDIVKNDSNSIYYAVEDGYYYARPVSLMLESNERIMPPSPPVQETALITAFPPNSMEKVGTIDKTGQLLLDNTILVIQTYNAIYGYNVQDKAKPQQVWKIDLKNNATIEHARLYNGIIYLVLASNIDQYKPCPYIPTSIGGKDVSIACTDIYHPRASSTADATYTLLKINPKTGTEEGKVSFIGSRYNSTVYMSADAIYVALGLEPDIVSFLTAFFEEKATDLVPVEVRDRMKKLQTYDISYAAKMTEVYQILQGFMYGSSNDEQLKIQTELENRMKKFAAEHKKELSSSQIVKFSSKNLQQQASTIIPGKLLNQFSMDEFNGNIRVAVTIGGFSEFGSTETSNDVYILGNNLQMRGSVTDLGKGEQIYSARFIGNRGYVVTFKQIDPFYVLDLSNPDAPSLKGELKIPGFSSYLHPLSDTIIAGIGRDTGNAKVSLFDVSNPSTPTEVATYALKDYSSDILQTHHAFLNDAKHQVMFIPGDTNGYIMSYKNNELNLVKAISDINPSRALYMNDYMYIIGSQEIVVYDEKTWEEVKRLDLSE